MRNKLLIGGCILSLLTTGCLKELDYNKNRVTNGDFFDFKIDQSTSLSVDYCFPNEDYPVLFEVYNQNPQIVNEEGELVKLDIDPIYRATTNGSGQLTAEIQIPSYLTKVWLYSEYSGALSSVELEVKDNKIEFNQNAYLAQLRANKTRATTGNKHTYPDNWLILGDWDQYGTPDYLEEEQTMPSGKTLYSINELFVKYSKTTFPTRYPEYFADNLSSDLKIIKSTKVYLVFINSTAQWKSALGYYTYPTGTPPQSANDIQRIIAFPSVTQFMRKAGDETVRGALVGGDRVQLKYWDGKQFHEEFPAGVTIGWWLEGMSFRDEKGGNIEIQGKGLFSRFSTDKLNADGQRRTVALSDAQTDRIVAIAFEDNNTPNYNDATFYLEVPEDNSIGGDLPPLPDVGGASEEMNFVKTDGFLMFEDIWPYGGDYDMNDVMVKYSTKVYKRVLNNLVYKIETEYTPFHNGGRIKSGFGFQFADLSLDAIRKVTITGETPSQFMEGQMLEPGQRRPTIILSDDITANIGNKIAVTIELNDVVESYVTMPFNPFIIPESDKSRTKEIHLVKQMPTDKVDMALFGTGHDGSNPKTKLFYVMNRNENQYPFALNMPFIDNIPAPEEQVNIDTSYPKFRSWVESEGKSNKDWYLYPVVK